jgi:hypothetical protein
MSKINTFRIINLNYNNNAIHVEDEIFHFDGESSMLSLQNGGGKTVLVQMMMAPFVHKRYRDTSDRTFEDFFTTTQPTHILVEWLLDGGAGFVLTGMMVRKRQAGGEEGDTEELEIITYIHEYREPNPYDIHQIPLIERDGKLKKLKSFGHCKKLFEQVRMDKVGRFQAFDLSQSNQLRQYFQRLKEFGINYEEWESIIKKVNLKESGLSELFREAKDEVGLVEKWFLPAIETKLNKEENRMKQFHAMLIKFIRLYKENEVKIKRKGTILEFEEDAHYLEELVNRSLDLESQIGTRQEQIAYLRHCIGEMLQDTIRKEEEAQQALEGFNSELTQVKYEESSYQIYQLIDQLEVLLISQNQVDRQKNELEHSHQEESKLLAIQQCAQTFEDYQSEEKNVLKLENQLDIMKEKEEELMPERNNLGYSLSLVYTENAEKLQDTIQELRDDLVKLSMEKNVLSQAERDGEDSRLKLKEELGSKKSRIEQYQEHEDYFNKHYLFKLEKNILGFYEEGIFEVLGKKQEQLLKQVQHTLTLAHTERQKREEEREGIQRNTQDCNLTLGQKKEWQKNLLTLGEKYEKEIEERLRHMKYLSIPEEYRFDREYLCSQFDTKIATLREILKKVEREKEEFEDELDRMKHGVVLEIPEEFEKLLGGLDIQYITGMEYLNRIGYSKEQKEELLSRVPLLPFSILMSEGELLRLSKASVDFYTSYPIPIIRKDQLGEFPARDHSFLFQEQQIHYFVMFNQQLLDEQQLACLLAKKEEQLQKVYEILGMKEDEIRHYDKMRQEIAYQQVDTLTYQQYQKDRETCEQQIEEYESQLVQLRGDKSENDRMIRELQERCNRFEEEKASLLACQTALKDIAGRYEQYLIDRKEMERISGKMNYLKEESENRRKRIEIIYQMINDKNQEVVELEQKHQLAEKRMQKYASYKEGVRLYKDTVDMEARYQAITEQIGSDVKLLEEQLLQARGRFVRIQERLIDLSEKHRVSEEEYKAVRYSEFRQKEMERNLQTLDAEIQRTTIEWNRLDKEIAIKESKIADRKQELLSTFEQGEPVPKEQIVDTAFQKRIKLIRLSIQDEDKKRKLLLNQINGYEANLSALSEFSNLVNKKMYDFSVELQEFHKSTLQELERKEIEILYGNLIRVYRSLQEQLSKHNQSLEKTIDSIMKKEKYQEEFYHQPIVLMHQLTERPEDLLRQLTITIQSFRSLLEKLEIDIQFIGREEEKVVEMLTDYVYEIYKNLEKIDRNSTIRVKERMIKMLRILIPSWNENKEIYQQRMTNFVHELVNAGLHCITENRNLEEMIGVRMTTKTLYDAVIGIATTNIKLYKIEAQREYPITWAEVSKNSGGEGFLSAFVVLACLLSYMRRDESELLMEREEGKVIVMDNPFAQTSASHLLIPLMDVAKKSNTQLICLSGLGGESIYNRFDNIYVLNLIGSALRRDVQYLKADQIKGDTKIYELSTARMQIEEVEQMELLF